MDSDLELQNLQSHRRQDKHTAEPQDYKPLLAQSKASLTQSFKNVESLQKQLADTKQESALKK